jgi:uncharacterized repeat protein (TIGR03803 family)
LLAGLIFDRAGNLYGATMQGGNYGLGTVFELTPTVGGGWTETVLYNFAGGADGAFPYGNLIFDSAGSLYGTNTQGGSYEHGTAFELSPREGGGWTEKILHEPDEADK